MFLCLAQPEPASLTFMTDTMGSVSSCRMPTTDITCSSSSSSSDSSEASEAQRRGHKHLQHAT
jgi:hypothetical protein